MKNQIFGVLLGLSVWCTSAQADVASTAQQAALNIAVNQFESDFFGGDYDAVARGIPPKIITLIADRSGMDPAVLRGIVADQMETTMQQVKLEAYSMNKDEAQWDKTEIGRAYALVPTQLQLKLPEGQTAQSNTYTLAFEDEKAWYLVRIDDLQQVEMLAEAYPDFKGISFPKATFKILD